MTGDNDESLIGAIYDAALDPSLWPGLLCRVRTATGATGSILFLNRGPDLVFTAFDGFDPSMLSNLPQIQDRDEYLKRRRVAPVLRPVVGSELIPYDEFRRTEFFHEFAKPLGSARICGTVLLETQDRLAAISVFRPDGAEEFGPTETSLLARLAPHFRRAISIMDRLQAAQSRAANRSHALRQLSVAMVCVDAKGKILDQNHFASEILEDGDGVGTRCGYLVGRGEENAETLKGLIGAAAAGAAGEAATGWFRRRSGIPLQAWSIPARPTAEGFPQFDTGPVAMLILKGAERKASPPEAVLRGLYDLSPAEARLACALAGGASVAEFADQAGITLNTARAQLKSVFRKTETRRQSDLVRLMMSALPAFTAIAQLGV